jgi:outer membrane immunogenic protein
LGRTLPVAAISLAITGAATGMTTVVAAAADFYAPSPLGRYSWIGPYIGANGGYEWGAVSGTSVQPSGFTGGVQAGYNWQQGDFVFGAETDLDLSGADATRAPLEFSSRWFGTVRGRAGLALGNVLLFGTAGLAYGDLWGSNAGLTESHANVGWVAGAGIEIGFAQHWSAKAEWLYLDLGDRNFAVTGANNGLSANLLRFGVNYRF